MKWYLRAAKLLSVAITGCATDLAQAESVMFSVAGDPGNSMNLSGKLLVRLGTVPGPGEGREVDLTFYNFAVDVASISGVSVEGGMLGDGRVVSTAGTRRLWGNRLSEAQSEAEPGGPMVIPAGWESAAPVGTVTWRYTMAPGTSFEDVVEAITGTATHAPWMRAGFTLSPTGSFGGGSDGYMANLVLTVPLPRSALVGMGTLGGVMCMGYVRRRGHLRY